MADKDKQPGVHKPQGRADVLRARDIIPGASQARAAGQLGTKPEIDIPRFDLAEDIMAEQRRITAIRRKGPGGAGPEEMPRVELGVQAASPPCWPEWDAVIADIVARDIERLCRGDYGA